MSSPPDSTGSTASTFANESTPLWEYVAMTDKSGAGGNKSFICNFCKMTFNGSYFRVKAHLLKITGHGIRACANVTKEEVARLSKLQEEADLRVKAKVPKQVPLPSGHGSSCPTTSVSIGAREGKRQRIPTAIDKVFTSYFCLQMIWMT
jgi:hypothetical protein